MLTDLSSKVLEFLSFQRSHRTALNAQLAIILAFLLKFHAAKASVIQSSIFFGTQKDSPSSLFTMENTIVCNDHVALKHTDLDWVDKMRLYIWMKMTTHLVLEVCTPCYIECENLVNFLFCYSLVRNNSVNFFHCVGQ